MTDWNPNVACASGLEWFPDRERTFQLDARNQIVGALLDSTAAETIEQVRVGTLNTVADPPGTWSAYLLEIFDVADLPTPAGLTTGTFLPSADLGNQSMYGWDAALSPGISPPTQTDLWRFVSDTPGPSSTFPNGMTVHDDSLVFPIFGASASVVFNLGGVIGSLPNTLITAVRVDVTASVYTLVGQRASGAVVPFIQIDGQRYMGPTIQIPSELAGANVETAVWTTNPATGCPWTVDDLEAFDDTTPGSGVGVFINPTGSSNVLTAVQRVSVDVDYQTAADNRQAIGCFSTRTGPANIGWTTIEIAAPDGTPGWSKAAATTYLFTLRRISGRGRMNVRLISDSTRLPPVPWTPALPRLYKPVGAVSDDRLYDYETADDPAAGTLPILLETATVTSQDSQGYLSIKGDGGGNIPFRPWTDVDSAQSLQQEITAGATDDYSWLRVLCRQQNPETTAPLVLQIRQRSDDAAVGGPVTIVSADLEPPRYGDDNAWQIIGAEITPAAALTSGTQYYVDITSAAPNGEGWQVQVASALPFDWESGPPPADIGDVLYGGTLVPPDRLTVDAVEYETMTAAVTVHTQEDAPANFAAVAVDDGGCLGHVALSWDTVEIAGCGGFDRWELERSDAQTDWALIATGTDDTATTFDDYEMRRNVETSYRVRVVRGDQAPGAWATDTATVAMDCCGYVFASNADPSLVVWADDPTDGRRAYDFVENVETMEFLGRKFGVQLHEAEWRGTRFAAPLLLAAEGGEGGTIATTTPGVRTFIAVLASFRPSLGAALPYTSVTTQDGDRWFASIESPSGLREEPQGSYTLDVVVREVTDLPEPQAPEVPSS